jgi:hypothetical protein
MAPALHLYLVQRGPAEEDTSSPPDTEQLQEDAMAKISKNVKSVLNQRVRMGFLTVPLWVVGAVYLTRKLRDRRRTTVTASF